MPAWGSHGGDHRSWVEGGRGGGFEEHCERRKLRLLRAWSADPAELLRQPCCYV